MGSLFFQWARSDEREQRRLDRAADRAEARQAAVIAGGSAPEVDDDDPLAAYNRQLRALADADAAQDRAARLRQR
jgi:hypothetical protein